MIKKREEIQENNLKKGFLSIESVKYNFITAKVALKYDHVIG